MTAEVATRNANPLGNKLIHADIHADITIQGVEDVTEDGKQRLQDVALGPRALHSKEDAAFAKKAHEMRMHWDECIGRDMRLPDGYSHVAVLLIKWADELDDQNTAEEAIELEALFRDRFKYDTKIVELNVRQKPQHQLKYHVGEFIMTHDGPQNLLIVYYTGHGTYNDEKKGILSLTATLNPVIGRGFSKDAIASWNDAEAQLKGEDVEADVLTILDTCYSSNLVKSANVDGKKFELLSACAIDQTTASPGDFSFTRALIDTTVKLLDEHPGSPISTSHLIQRINLDPRRAETPSFIWSRGTTVAYNAAHVLLAPLKKSISRPLRPKSFLTLRLGLKQESLDRRQIEFMTKTLTKAFNNSQALVSLRRADWVSIEPAPPISQWERVALVLNVIKQWKKFMVKRKDMRLQVDMPLNSRTEGNYSTYRPNKRSYDGAGDDATAKRPTLDVVQQPLSPVSTTSHVDEDV